MLSDLGGEHGTGGAPAGRRSGDRPLDANTPGQLRAAARSVGVPGAGIERGIQTI
jgi:hypothetical protein